MHDHLDRRCGAGGHPVPDDHARGAHDSQDRPDTVSEIDPYRHPPHRARRVEAWRRGMARRKRKDVEWEAHRRQLAERGAKPSNAVTAAMLYTTLDPWTARTARRFERRPRNGACSSSGRRMGRWMTVWPRGRPSDAASSSSSRTRPGRRTTTGSSGSSAATWCCTASSSEARPDGR